MSSDNAPGQQPVEMDEAEAKARRHRHTAGAFDIRTIIGALLGIYGVILVAVELFGDDTGDATGDLSANLWAGIGLIVVSVVFLLWVRLRPLVVEDGPDHQDPSQDTGSAGGEHAVGEDR